MEAAQNLELAREGKDAAKIKAAQAALDGLKAERAAAQARGTVEALPSDTAGGG